MDLCRTPRTARPLCAVLFLAGFLGATLQGCCGFSLCSYKALTADDIDERSDQAAAAITLSDPQIYSRETLVNDRKREAEYLSTLITASKDATFEPQIKRDLRLLTSTVVALQAAYDPLAGRQATREDELDDLKQQTEVAKQMKMLAEAQAELIEAK